MADAQDLEKRESTGRPETELTEFPKLPKLKQGELEQILETHEKWLQSEDFEKWVTASEEEKKEHTKGRASLGLYNLQSVQLVGKDLCYADLRGVLLSAPYLGRSDLNLQHAANLQGAKLVGAQLQGALIRGVNLEGADLHDADLEGADLCHAKLQRADLRRANLSTTALSKAKGLENAILEDVKLDKATGLTGVEFARTNITGAKLPSGIRDFDILGVVEETAKNARKLFLSMILGCVYVWLTIATTTDARLLTNSATSPLPIIQAAVPIAGFYWAAPLILLAIYIWFHLYLQEMWKGLASLPARFPDGKALDEKAYPWLLTGLVRRYFAHLKTNRPALSLVKENISILLAWWVVPFTFLIFWLRYLSRHDWPGTLFHMGLLVIVIMCALRFQHLAKLTLQGDGVGMNLRKLVASGMALFFLAAVVSDGAINGTKVARTVFDHRAIIPQFLPWAFADLTEADVSTKPKNWFAKDDKIDLVEVVNGARLRGADFRFAKAGNAFLVRADLTDANLAGADLRGADLTGATLDGADLRDAILENAILTNIDALDAKFHGARLGGANLNGANLVYSRGLTGESLRATRRSDDFKFPLEILFTEIRRGRLPVAPREIASGRLPIASGEGISPQFILATNAKLSAQGTTSHGNGLCKKVPINFEQVTSNGVESLQFIASNYLKGCGTSMSTIEKLDSTVVEDLVAGRHVVILVQDPDVSLDELLAVGHWMAATYPNHAFFLFACPCKTERVGWGNAVDRTDRIGSGFALGRLILKLTDYAKEAPVLAVLGGNSVLIQSALQRIKEFDERLDLQLTMIASAVDKDEWSSWKVGLGFSKSVIFHNWSDYKLGRLENKNPSRRLIGKWGAKGKGSHLVVDLSKIVGSGEHFYILQQRKNTLLMECFSAALVNSTNRKVSEVCKKATANVRLEK